VSGTKLVIVESPTKVKSISQYLGADYTVLASVGHIRDLIEPKNLPAELKKGSVGKFSVDVDNGFEPYYVVSDAKKKTVADLKRALKDADELILATDEDREGEAIAWHLLEVLKPKVPVKRMVFHEITREAIEAAKDHTRSIDEHLVDAQETRRILDRLYGYEVSPVLWRKVGPGLSAGRVQSAATRLIVERERERLAFVRAPYWSVEAEFAPRGGKPAAGGPSSFVARLTRIDGRRVATGRDFGDDGKLKNDAIVVGEASATMLADGLRAETTPIAVRTVESKPYTRRPAAPFTTSTLQQEAARKLRFTARQTMSVAQSLYENGHITYMRTDSPALSTQATQAARSQAAKLYGAETVPSSPRVYGSKSKNAQEAHEAVRPSGSTFALPSELRSKVSPNELKLYDLIWKRTIASQMADAKRQTATVTIDAGPLDVVDAQGVVAPRGAEFQASGTVITFRGFLAAYEEGTDEARNAEPQSGEAKLPPLAQGQPLDAENAEAKSHETAPPPRYTEASLVKTLDELGIGRPSTYASIISTIIDRGYVSSRGSALVPSWTAFSVVRLLEEHFHDLVEYDFTAQMEGDLDRIAAGEENRTDWLRGFYFGTGEHQGLRGVIDDLGEIDAREINSTRIAPDAVLRIGRYGPYLEVSAEDAETPRRVNVPEDLAPDELTAEKARELIEAPVQTDRELGIDPATGNRILVKDGRFGPYVTEAPVAPVESETAPAASAGDAKSADAETAATAAAAAPAAKPRTRAKKAAEPKPRTASLFKSMIPEQVTLEQALQLLDLPRVVGVDEESGAEITAQNGRYGAYLKKGAETRSLPGEDAIFTIDLAGAQELFAQPKYGNRTTKSAIKEFDADPVSGKPVKIKDGRFGPYITDGVTNITVPRGENPEEVTFERAVQLLAEKREKGPAKKPAAKKAPAKKPAAAKSTTTRASATKKTTAAAKKPATTRARSTTARSAKSAPGAEA